MVPWLEAAPSFPRSFFPPHVALGAASTKGMHVRAALLSVVCFVAAAAAAALVFVRVRFGAQWRATPSASRSAPRIR